MSHSHTKPATRVWNVHTVNSFFSLHGAVVNALTRDGAEEEVIEEFKDRAKALKGDEERLLALAREFVEF